MDRQTDSPDQQIRGESEREEMRGGERETEGARVRHDHKEKQKRKTELKERKKERKNGIRRINKERYKDDVHGPVW